MSEALITADHFSFEEQEWVRPWQKFMRIELCRADVDDLLDVVVDVFRENPPVEIDFIIEALDAADGNPDAELDDGDDSDKDNLLPSPEYGIDQTQPALNVSTVAGWEARAAWERTDYAFRSPAALRTG